MLKNGFRRRLASEAPLQHSSNSQNHTLSSSPVFLQILLAILPFVPSPRAAFYNGPVGPQGQPLLSLPSLPARRPRGRDIVWLMCVSGNRSTAGVGEQRALGLSSSSNDNKCSPHPIRGCSPPAATSTSEAQPPACLKIILPSSFPLSGEETHPGTNTRTHTHTHTATTRAHICCAALLTCLSSTGAETCPTGTNCEDAGVSASSPRRPGVLSAAVALLRFTTEKIQG